MLLSNMRTNPAKFQKRDAAFSEATVCGIVAEGIDLSKFDPIPVLPDGTVGGAGHSRFEAICRLHKLGQLPEQWMSEDDWDIPTRTVTEDEAIRLAWTENLSRDAFKPCEEAGAYQEMLDSGLSLAEVATLAHKSTHHVRKMLPLNTLCREIRCVVGAPADAGGIDKHVAQVMAERFQRYNLGPMVQRELFQKVFKNMELTANFIAAFLDRIGAAASRGSKDDAATGDGFLFNIPPAVENLVKSMRDNADNLRRAQRGLAWLLQCKDSGVLDDYAELKTLLDRTGDQTLEQLKQQVVNDAAVLGGLCTAA